jgi:hypothetical protein
MAENSFDSVVIYFNHELIAQNGGVDSSYGEGHKMLSIKWILTALLRLGTYDEITSHKQKSSPF